MTAEIINLPVVRIEHDPVFGPREAVIDIALHLPNDTSQSDAESWADWLRAELWARGFKIVPVDPA